MEGPALLALVFIIVTAIGIVDAFQYRLAKELDARPKMSLSKGCLFIIASSLVHGVVIVVAGWVDMMLWNMVAPTLDLPTLDLVTAIALGWLIGFLFRGVSPMRVRVHGTLG